MFLTFCSACFRSERCADSFHHASVMSSPEHDLLAIYECVRSHSPSFGVQEERGFVRVTMAPAKLLLPRVSKSALLGLKVVTATTYVETDTSIVSGAADLNLASIRSEGL